MYGIPYRCLVPLDVDGLLVAGRCFSATHDAHASARSMATCMAMGQAAGTAAVLAAAGGRRAAHRRPRPPPGAAARERRAPRAARGAGGRVTRRWGRPVRGPHRPRHGLDGDGRVSRPRDRRRGWRRVPRLADGRPPRRRSPRRSRRAGGRCGWHAADLRREDEVEAAFRAFDARLGRLDAVYSVAGISGRRYGDGPLHAATLEGWETVLATNATSQFLVARAAIARMLAQEPDAAGSRGACS